MRVAVTGAGGFLGSHLTKRLRERLPDASVVGVVRRLPEEQVAGVRYMNRLEPVDLVFHLAGGGGIAAAQEDPRGDLLLNTATTVEVLEQIRQVGVGRLVAASSAAVYGRAHGSVSEDQPPAPASPYGVSKLASELYVHAYERLYGVSSSIARVGNAYGPGQRQLVIYDLAVRALRAAPPLHLRGTGEEVRDFIHVSDVVDALIAIGLHGEPGATYNVASGRHSTMLEVATLVGNAAGLEAGTVTTDGRGELGKVSVFCPSIERLTNLGFKAQMPLERGIEETVAWVRKQR
jgi:UDP-glucose 4-epimerase